jgi:hypothetical protein
MAAEAGGAGRKTGHSDWAARIASRQLPVTSRPASRLCKGPADHLRTLTDLNDRFGRWREPVAQPIETPYGRRHLRLPSPSIPKVGRRLPGCGWQREEIVILGASYDPPYTTNYSV